jgi:phosphate transport system substrate-binding protein
MATNYKFNILLALLTLIITSTADARRTMPPEVFKIQGDSQSLAAVIFPMIEVYQNATKIPLIVTGELSALKGLEEADKGIGDALVVAMSFEDLNNLASKAGLERRNKALTQHSILLNDVSYSVIVNPANPVSSLSKKELRRIFSGKYKDWDDVDGKKAPVSIVWGEWSTGVSWVMSDRVMDGEPIIKNMVKAESIEEIVANVAGDPNAIGIIPTTSLTTAVKAVDTTELKIEGPIILVTVGFPTSKHFQLIKLIKGEERHHIGY